ncbi:hypothetical protein CHS0354_020924 [Potamilus streckersoni]|uniref:Uncharacterized protein n=1 Tax=Potamilus streckersoni TaxID=2493646 RepID=A0AAE0SV58_9BIVA|nr:hypothetical protein CHS0354_020924 [Potamilus streckersoni]
MEEYVTKKLQMEDEGDHIENRVAMLKQIVFGATKSSGIDETDQLGNSVGCGKNNHRKRLSLQNSPTRGRWKHTSLPASDSYTAEKNVWWIFIQAMEHRNLRKM